MYGEIGSRFFRGFKDHTIQHSSGSCRRYTPFCTGSVHKSPHVSRPSTAVTNSFYKYKTTLASSICYVTNWEESRIQNIVPLPRPERAKLDVPGRYPLRLTSCPAASGFRPGQVCAMAPMLMVLYHRNSRIAFAHANSISYMLSGCAVR